jgi:two-component system OmpR family sensor kinase
MPDPPASSRFLSGIRHLPDRTPLRVKLITAVLVLVAIALAVISIAGISVIRTYLLGQADSQLQTLSGPAQRAVGEYIGGASPGTSQIAAVDWIPSGGHLQQVVEPVAAGFGSHFGPGQGQVLPGPAVPTDTNWLAAHQGSPVTVPAQSGGGRWRALLDNVSYQSPGGNTVTGTVVVAVDVTTAYATIGRLTVIDLLVSAAIIIGIAILGIAVVRASLRPLTDIERTAEAIAAGDLTRRVPDRDPRTEVGRLGRSLNAMLAQIEAAFGARAESEYAARRSEDKMRQFVADASHELRTPLTAIRGFAEYYRQRGGLGEAETSPRPAASNGAGPAHADDGAIAADATVARPADGTGAAARGQAPLARADLDRIMRRVEQESSRMGVLVEDMLLLARLDQQRPLEFRPVDLLTLAADAVHDARVVAPDRSINLTVGAGAALIVLGDEVRLRQVTGNLMSNALTHTPDGTPVDVRIRSGSMAGPQRPAPASAAGGPQHPPAPLPAVILEVADQGPGLTSDQAEHVFERFYRADQARTRKAGGTGLGLAIVAALVAAHGGAVWVESPPGGGATFRIALPLAPEARQSGPEPDETPEDESPQPDIIEHGTIEHGTIASGRETLSA